jgi:peptide/nickel transport system ATP-binding protein
VDGQDIRDVTQVSLRAAIGVVPQDTVLFNDTIRYNIAYGRPGATDEEVVAAAKLAQVHDFVERLPDGYRTMVGERGLKLSGGEKQRVAIARALAGNPDLIVADEPTSALDVSVQAAVLNLLLEIQARNKAAFIVISHDLSVVLYLADYIAVMYLGHLVEYGPAADFLHPPYHPYTEALLAAIPLPDPALEKKKIRLPGTIPSALDPPEGCVFHTRCPRYIGDICHTDPPVRTFGKEHFILCHHEKGFLASCDPVLKPQPGKADGS